MQILLDTHAFLWFVAGSSKLSPLARRLIEEPTNQRFMSVVSAWEIAIKMNRGKLKVGSSFDQLIPHQLHENDIVLLPIYAEHLSQVTILPLHHRDPFDRLMIAQSIVENIPIISKDSAFDAYRVKRLW
jgi:PIN domain nuclease of toxin-antitoxin system